MTIDTDVREELSVLEQALSAFREKKVKAASGLKRALDRRKEYDPEVHARFEFEDSQARTADLLLKRIGRTPS